MYFDMPSSHTVHKKGCREVRRRSTGAEKRRPSLRCIWYATTNGHIQRQASPQESKPPTRTRGGGTEESVERFFTYESVDTENPVSIQKKQHALLVWDTFSGHMTTDVAEMLRKNNITVTVIPGGCTSKIQPLDVCLNKRFKNHCRRHWVEYMQQQVATQDPGEKIKPASKQQVIDWVVQSNDLLDPQVFPCLRYIQCT